MSAFEPGQTISRYRVIRPLGQGAMGEVYLADDPQIERRLAIKTVRLEGSGIGVEERKQRLLREAKAAGRLLHPNVVTLFDAGDDDGLLFLAFEFVDGSDLANRLLQAPPLTRQEAVSITRQAAEALAFAHEEGIVHRDIKPSNLLLDEKGRVKISDFGIAKMVGQQTELTMTGSVVGSPHYLSPEQVRGEELDGRSDLFSLGVVAYQMLSGARPFEGETITNLIYQILHKDPVEIPHFDGSGGERLQEILRRMLAKDRDERYPSARALADDLHHLEVELGGAPQIGTHAAPVVRGAETDTSTTDPTRLLGSEEGGALPAQPAIAAVGSSAFGSAAAPSRARGWIVVAATAVSVVVLGGIFAFGAWWEAATGSALPDAEPSAVAESLGEEELRSEGVGEELLPFEVDPEGPVLEELTEQEPTGGADTKAEPAPVQERATPPAPEPSSEPRQQTPPRQISPAEPSAGEAEAGAPPRIGPEASDFSPLPGEAERPEGRDESDSAEPRVSTPGELAVDRTVSSGTRVTFQVEPESAHVVVDGTVLGRASELVEQGGYSFASPGEHLVVFRSPGRVDYRIRVQVDGARAGRTTLSAQMGYPEAQVLPIEDLPVYRAVKGIFLKVKPTTAQVSVNGRPRGSAAQFSRRGRFLRLDKGLWRISLEAPGHQRIDFAVEISSGAQKERLPIRIDLPAQP